jgi:hypothetical protein
MSVEQDEEDQHEDVDLVAGAWRRVGEPPGGTREREPLWTGSWPSNDPSRDNRVELERPIQTPQNRRAELQPKRLRQLRLRWRRRWRGLEGGRRRLRRRRRNRWPLPPGPSWEFQVSPAPPVSEALRGSPPWAFPPQTQGPGFMAGASFPGITCITGFWPILPSLLGRFLPFCRLFRGNCEERHTARGERLDKFSRAV